MLRESNEYLLECFHSTMQNCLRERLPVNIFASDKNGYVKDGNTRMIETLKETKETFIGSHLSKWGEENWDNCKKVIETGLECRVEEIGIDNRVYLTVRTPVFKDDTTIVGVIGISLDITEEKQAEITKFEFMMNMGHEIRTPFCGIITVLELLYAKEKDMEKKHLLEMSLYSSRRLLLFMNDIHEVSRLGHLPLDDELCDIKTMVENIVIFLSASIAMKGLKIEVACTGDEIIINRYRIEKILLNLIGNAVKFTERGIIMVSIKTAPILTIVVSDTGIGIDKKYHEKIFDDFFQIISCYKKDDYAGIGKGLYLVKKYTKELQGKITLDSQLGEGSTFQVEIPCTSI